MRLIRFSTAKEKVPLKTEILSLVLVVVLAASPIVALCFLLFNYPFVTIFIIGGVLAVIFFFRSFQLLFRAIIDLILGRF